MSEIRANTVSNAAGTGPVTLTGQSAAKAWANYNQVLNIVNDSFNVSSVSDDSVGIFTVSFSSSMANSDYSALITCGSLSGGANARTNGTFRSLTSSSSSLRSYEVFAGDDDVDTLNGVSFSGDLA